MTPGSVGVGVSGAPFPSVEVGVGVGVLAGVGVGVALAFCVFLISSSQAVSAKALNTIVMSDKKHRFWNNNFMRYPKA